MKGFRSQLALGGMAVLLVALFLASSTNWLIGEGAPEIYAVSVLIDDPGESGYQNFKQGVEQAALRYNVDVNFLARYPDADSAQQLSFLERELERGTQGVVLHTKDPAILEELLSMVPLRVPVVLYDCMADSTRPKAQILPDYNGMADALLTVVAKEESAVGEILLAAEAAPTEQMMAERLAAGLTHAGWEVAVSVLPAENLPQQLWRAAQLGTKIFAIGNAPLQAVGAAAATLEVPPHCYGIGWGGQTRNAIEQGSLRAVVAPNGFDGGYLSLQAVVRSLERQLPRDEILSYVTVTAETMYQPEQASLLFPIR